LLFVLTVTIAPHTSAAVFVIDAPIMDSVHVHSSLDYHLERITSMLKIEYTDTIRVVIATDLDSFNRALGSDFPDWGAAAAVKAKRLILIKSPSHFRVGKSLDELLGHELGHLMLDEAAAGRWLPRWFEEGFCQLVSGEWRISQDIRITRAVWGSGLIPLTALESVNRFGGAKASLAYAESYLAVSSLAKEMGSDFFAEFLSDYKAKGNIYKAFFNSTGYHYIEWVGIWQRKTGQKYRLVFFLFDSRLLFPLLAILFILLYILKMYQVRKRKKQWQERERLHGDDQTFPT
jgi:hypothetical protein